MDRRMSHDKKLTIAPQVFMGTVFLRELGLYCQNATFQFFSVQPFTLSLDADLIVGAFCFFLELLIMAKNASIR